ncbi:MAG: DUF3667 domain-containing protein [Bacteroidota bacterium]
MEPTTCTNCGATMQGDYCSACGQKALKQRISIKLLLGQLMEGLFNVERSLWQTCKAMFVRPHVVVREYLGGKRKKYVNPGRYLIFGVTMATLPMLFIDLYDYSQNSFWSVDAGRADLQAEMYAEIQKYYNVLLLMLIPVMALFTRLFYRKPQYGYAEHLVLNAYVLTQVNLVAFVFMVLQILLPQSWAGWLSMISLLVYGYMIWTFTRFFEGRTWWLLLKGVFTLLLMAISLAISGTIVGLMVYMK